jgi:hypothetical protein
MAMALLRSRQVRSQRKTCECIYAPLTRSCLKFRAKPEALNIRARDWPIFFSAVALIGPASLFVSAAQFGRHII